MYYISFIFSCLVDDAHSTQRKNTCSKLIVKAIEQTMLYCHFCWIWTNICTVGKLELHHWNQYCFSVDNSEWMRNGDFLPTRIQAQQDAVNIICRAKTQQNPENNVALLTTARCVIHLLFFHPFHYVHIYSRTVDPVN